MKKSKRLKAIGVTISLIAISAGSVGLFAADATGWKERLKSITENPSNFNYTAFYEIEAAKEQIKAQRTELLTTLVAGLIAYTEGQYDTAIKQFQVVGQSDDIGRLIKMSIPGGIETLIAECERKSGISPYPPADKGCEDCNGTGWQACRECRGVGKAGRRTEGQQAACTACRGLGATRCLRCGAVLSVKPQDCIELDERVHELIVKAVYLKNGGADVFTR